MIRTVTILAVLFLPVSASANVILPALLVINATAWLPCVIPIVFTEALLIYAVTNQGVKSSLSVSLKVNFLSSLVFFLVAPVVLGAVTALLSLVTPISIHNLLLVIGTWVGGNDLLSDESYRMANFWMVVFYCLTVIFENSLLKRIQGITFIMPSRWVSVLANALSYLMIWVYHYSIVSTIG